MTNTDEEWLSLKKETRRRLNEAAWIPLRASVTESNASDMTDVGYIGGGFYCGSAAFPPEYKEQAKDLDWSDLGIGTTPGPYAFNDGSYKTASEYRINDTDTIGRNLIFVQPSAPGFSSRWIIDPDLILALDLYKENNGWVRPDEGFVEVIREHFDPQGNHSLIEIRKEHLLDYLSARDLDLKIAFYRQRIKNFESLEASPFSTAMSEETERDGGRFSLRVTEINNIFGGQVSVFRVWHDDFDNEVDAPILADTDRHTARHESRVVEKPKLTGIRVETEFWGTEWIENNSSSERVRGDKPKKFPEFIVATDGSSTNSDLLNYEDVGRWLWFQTASILGFLQKRGFNLLWHTADTGSLVSPSGYHVHFGINAVDLVNVYAQDVARLPLWEQRLWASYNVTPQGGISEELADSQVRTSPAKTYAPEMKLSSLLEEFVEHFKRQGFEIMREEPGDAIAFSVSRFHGYDEQSILRLAKDIIRYFLERLDIDTLRTAAEVKKEEKLGSIKLIERLLQKHISVDHSRDITSVLVGIYELRIGDAHATSSKIESSFELAKIDRSASFLRQAEQLIDNCAYTIWRMLNAMNYR